ncbi:MAG: DUF3488 and transglutaminase-like domain-containing protein [Thermoleophilia bacterium]|nr:DUF3488 and transglutaminase-like domain-containing protein [Thermoleophilia bacterium]
MKAASRLLYVACFAGLAAIAAVALDGALSPSNKADMLRAALMATLCASAGLINRRLWPLAVVLLPVGCYLFLRITLPLPAWVEQISEQYRFYTHELYLGSVAYRTALFPLNLKEHPELGLLVAFALYWTAGAAAFCALSLRKALPGTAILLVVLGFGLTVDQTQRKTWLLLVFLAVAAGLLALEKTADRGLWQPRRLLAGLGVGALAGAVALALLLTVPSAAAKPLKDWRTWDPFKQHGAGNVFTFSWLENYPRLLDPANNAPVMDVESPNPSYWRAAALDHFTGTAWVTTKAFITELEPEPRGEGAKTTYAYNVPAPDPRPQGISTYQRFRGYALYTNYLFTGGDPVFVTVDSKLPLRMNDTRTLRTSQPLGPVFDYSVAVVQPIVAPSSLVGRPRDYPESVDIDSYLLLPFPRLSEITGGNSGLDPAETWRTLMWHGGPPDPSWADIAGSAPWREMALGETREWVDLYDLNQKITEGATDPYEIALRIEQYLRRNYTYTLAPPASDYSSPYAAFLFDTRAGYCQHFAGSMAILLRYNDIPARVAVGFTAGQKIGPNRYRVFTNNAHAWVEAYFSGVGWVSFDPTPGRSLPVPGPSSTSPGFVNPYTSEGASPPQTVTTLPRWAGRPLEDGLDLEDGPSTGRAGWLTRVPWLPWVIGILVVVTAWPLGRRMWKQRRLYFGSAQKRLEASIALLRQDLADYGAPVAPGHTYEEMLRLAELYLGIHVPIGIAERVDALLFGGQLASRSDYRQVETVRKRVRSHLARKHRMSHGWWKALLLYYGLQPAAESLSPDIQ